MSDFVKFTKRESVVASVQEGAGGAQQAEETSVVLRGNGNAKKHLVGRDTDLCSWVLTHETASRRHAVVTVRQDKRCVTIRDNKSSFGVYLNRKKLPPDVTVNVKKRDVISFGKSPDSWFLSEIHFLSEAELVGIDEAGIRAYLFVLGKRETRSIARPDDFVPLSKLLELHSGALKNYHYEPIKYLNAARLDPQQRLEVERGADGELFLRSRHTHVPKVDECLPVRELNEADLELIDSNGGTVVHATHFQHINKIRDVGLSRMDKAYIHFFRQPPERRKCLPGHTKGPNVLVFVDVREAAAHGIRFFESTGDTKEDNELVLSPGNLDGFIPAHLLHHIIHASTKSTILSHEEVLTMRRVWKEKEIKRKAAEAIAAKKEAEKAERRRIEKEEKETILALQAQRLAAAAGEDFFDDPSKAANAEGDDAAGSGKKSAAKNMYLTGVLPVDGDANEAADSATNPFEAAAAAREGGKGAAKKKKLKPVGGSRRKRLCL